MNNRDSLVRQFGSIDIYLFDQFLRGRIRPGMRIFDAGCGGGRNLVYLLRLAAAGQAEVFANDIDSGAIASVRRLARELAPECPAENFRVECVEDTSFGDASADVVISSAVLHFAASRAHFRAMLNAMWRVLRPGGLLFCRLASSIGIEDQVRHTSDGRYLLPDGSERYLVSASMLEELTGQLGGELADPIKTTLVHAQRSMTTWVLRKNAAHADAET